MKRIFFPIITSKEEERIPFEIYSKDDIALFSQNEAQECSAHARAWAEVAYTWDAINDILIKGIHFIPRVGFLSLPSGLPDKIELEKDEING